MARKHNYIHSTFILTIMTYHNTSIDHNITVQLGTNTSHDSKDPDFQILKRELTHDENDLSRIFSKTVSKFLL